MGWTFNLCKEQYPPAPNNLLLTIPRQYFCCGSSLLHVVLYMFVWSSAIESPELQLPIMFPVLFCFVIHNRKYVKK